MATISRFRAVATIGRIRVGGSSHGWHGSWSTWPS
jgi:hypothetical protein